MIEACAVDVCICNVSMIEESSMNGYRRWEGLLIDLNGMRFLVMKIMKLDCLQLSSLFLIRFGTSWRRLEL